STRPCHTSLRCPSRSAEHAEHVDSLFLPPAHMRAESQDRPGGKLRPPALLRLSAPHALDVVPYVMSCFRKKGFVLVVEGKGRALVEVVAGRTHQKSRRLGITVSIALAPTMKVISLRSRHIKLILGASEGHVEQ